ncbi:hypothetical protein [Klebsiella phage vB_KshKPC-M]|nr:hypothetical protein [Klebsiella phage vB_KshKPC-M]
MVERRNILCSWFRFRFYLFRLTFRNLLRFTRIEAICRGDFQFRLAFGDIVFRHFPFRRRQRLFRQLIDLPKRFEIFARVNAFFEVFRRHLRNFCIIIRLLDAERCGKCIAAGVRCCGTVCLFDCFADRHIVLKRHKLTAFVQKHRFEVHNLFGAGIHHGLNDHNLILLQRRGNRVEDITKIRIGVPKMVVLAAFLCGHEARFCLDQCGCDGGKFFRCTHDKVSFS